MAARPFFAAIPLILTAAATLFLLFVILAGTRAHPPLDQIWFLSVDTSAIQGAPQTAAWTLWNVCDSSSGSSTACSGIQAAYPFQPSTNFGSGNNVPAQVVSDASFFYYGSRAMFAFYIISIFFSGIAVIFGLLACCSRIGAGLTAILTTIASVACIIAAALMTAVFVKAKNDFQAAGVVANVGVKAFGFTWGAVGALIVSTVLFCCTCCISRRETTATTSTRRRGLFTRRRKNLYDSESNVPVNGSF